MSITSEVIFMQSLMEIRKKRDSAGELFRFWRKFNRMSQMGLGLEIGVSTNAEDRAVYAQSTVG